MSLEGLNPHLAAEPVLAGAPLAGARRAAVVVHGRAQSPEYMQDELVSRLALDDVAYVLPRAAGASWYPGRYFEPRAVNEPWLGHALAALSRSIELVVEAGIGPERIVLAGFSQGGCMVCDHVARRPERYCGVAILTGCLVGTPDDRSTPDATLDGVPIYLGTREHDDWVSAADVRATAAAFAQAGAAVSLDVRKPGRHGIDHEDVTAVRALLS